MVCVQEKVKAIVATTSQPAMQAKGTNPDAPVVNPYHTNPPDFRKLGEEYDTFKPL
jgi:hypothetical protein